MRMVVFQRRQFFYQAALILPLLFSLGVTAGDSQTVPQIPGYPPAPPAQSIPPSQVVPPNQGEPGQPNILVNGDFHDGSKMWTGDLSDNDDSDPNPLEAPTSGPMVLKLRPHRAIRLFQTFASEESSSLIVKAFYKLSDGFRFTGPGLISQVASDIHRDQTYRTIVDGNGVTSTPINDPDWRLLHSSFTVPVAIIADIDNEHLIVRSLDGLNFGMGGRPDGAFHVEPHRHYRLYIAFPPGDGTVEINKVELFGPR